MRADSVHLVKETFSFAVQFAFDAQGGKLVAQPGCPARRVGPPAVPSVDENFRRSSSLIAHAEGAIFLSLGMTLSRRKSFGRFPRSVEMITHRPRDRVLNATPAKQSSSKMFWVPARLGNLETLNCTASGGPREDVPVKPLHIGGLNASLCNRTTAAARGSYQLPYVKPAGTLAT